MACIGTGCTPFRPACECGTHLSVLFQVKAPLKNLVEFVESQIDRNVSFKRHRVAVFCSLPCHLIGFRSRVSVTSCQEEKSRLYLVLPAAGRPPAKATPTMCTVPFASGMV